MSNLMLHRGAQQVSRERVADIPVPMGTNSWVPIAHHDLIEQTVDRFAGLGWSVDREQHGLWRDGLRYFGVFDLKGADLDGKPYTLAVGLANSHDQSIAAKIAVGSRVFVCDNLAFSGEVTVSRKHTTHLMAALPQVIAGAVAKVSAMRIKQDARIETYQRTDISDMQAHDVLVRAMERNAIPARELPRVLKEWKAPSHPEFDDRNLWSLFNGFTQVLKGTSVAELPNRTMRLHALCDEVAGGIVLPAEAQEQLAALDAAVQANEQD